MSQYIQKYATEATYNVGMQNTNLGGEIIVEGVTYLIFL